MGQIDTTYISGSRFYFDAADPSRMLPGVTSVLNVIPKDFLRWWTGKEAAYAAIQKRDILDRLVRDDGEEETAKWLAGAASRYTKSRSKIGSEAHNAFERMIRGESLGFVSRRIETHVRFFGEFLDRVQPELLRAEDVAWSDTHGYSGSFDAVLRIKLDDQGMPDPQGDPAVVMCDWKTSKGTYEDVALQMSAYAYADKIIAPDGSSSPMPKVDGGMVLHSRVLPDPEETPLWAFKPVEISEPVHGMFLKCLDFFSALREWDGEGRGRTRVPGLKERVIGKPIAGSALFQSGTERRG